MINKHRLLLSVFAVVLAVRSHAVPPTIPTLPAPVRDGRLTVETALSARRSVREFRHEALTLTHISQLLWATQGISGAEGGRTAPSAGALYPLEVYAVIGRVENLAPGVYRYRPQDHALEYVAGGDRRAGVAAAALGQGWIQEAPLVVVIAAVYSRTTRKYGQRGHRYVHMEAGGAGENLCLQAVALQLGTTVVGAFDDAALQKLLHLPQDEQPLVLIPVGKPR
ncbi:MAG: SagB/ThcOx family dehydrogenase [Opitutaceae bacterium]|nr:SagB/ThcOx family dehydrogenase [Opitutaceae bacterium]